MSLENVRTILLEKKEPEPFTRARESESSMPPAKYPSILAACEDIATPLLRNPGIADVHVNVITHGFVFNDPTCLRLLNIQPNVHLLTLSKTLRDRLLERYKFSEDRVTNTGYGIDIDFFMPDSEGLSTPHIIVSAGMANRDYNTLVDAVREVKADLYIAADSEWHPSTPIDIADGILPRHVHLASVKNYTALRALYARALFVVVPLYPTAFACGYAVISEAMAMGKAVIATRTECYSDFIIDGETGFYVRPRDAADLHEKICYLLAHPEVALSMGRTARKRIELFSHREYCRKLFRVVTRVG